MSEQDKVKGVSEEGKIAFESYMEAKKTKQVQQINDMMPESYHINKVEVAPLSPAIFRIHENILVALNEKDGTILDAEENGLLLVYLMVHATKSKRVQLWKDARNPIELFDKFISWNFEQKQEDVLGLLAELGSQIEDYSKATEILGDANDNATSEDEKQKAEIEQKIKKN